MAKLYEIVIARKIYMKAENEQEVKIAINNDYGGLVDILTIEDITEIAEDE